MQHWQETLRHKQTESDGENAGEMDRE